MTKEEKRLLLIDLCGRSPYSVKVNINSPIEEQNRMKLFDVNLESETIGVGNGKWMFRAVPVEDEDGRIVKPYLRPMSSMTKEELEELNEKYGNIAYFFIQEPPYYYGLQAQHSDIGSIEISEFSEVYDWLDAHYLDYRGLIGMGLADEALEGMYDKEEGSEVQVPKTVDEAVSTLGRILSDEDREYLLENGAISMHDSLGRWIRNEWGLWTDSELKNELKKKGFEHPDDMSNYIIEEFIKYWNSRI